MKKSMLLIMSGLMLFVLSFGIVGFTSEAAHINPNNGLPCNNTSYRLAETTLCQSWNEYHYSGTAPCTKYFAVYAHEKYCTSCSRDLGAGNAFKCTEDHSVCSIHNKSCNGLYY